MINRIKVIVFGVRNSKPRGKCSCGDCCDSTKFTGRLYYDLVQFIDGSDIEDFIEMKFVDLSMNPDGNNAIEYFIDHGFGVPLTTMNGNVILYGGISNNVIYQEVKNYMFSTGIVNI